MGTSVFDSELLKDAWSTEEMRGVFNDAARMQRWLDVEAALAQAQAELGMIPERAAREIASKSRYEAIDRRCVSCASPGIRWRPRYAPCNRPLRAMPGNMCISA